MKTSIRRVALALSGVGVVVAATVAGVVFASGASAASGADGFASLNGGTTGGSGGSTVTVSSLSALTAQAKARTRQIVRVNGNIRCSSDITVASDKTILGVGANSGLTGCGLRLKGVRNVVIQNMNIAKVKSSSGSGDAIHIEKSVNVWIDHNDLSSDMDNGKDYYDGLCDITHAADYITVSWNRFHDHYKALLVGHSDSNAGEDSGHLRVTFHHNLFVNTNSRTPSLRFGKGHVYSNYFSNGSTGVHSRMGAQMLVQNNVFANVKTPVQTNVDSKQDGFVNIADNDFGSGTNKISKTGSFTNPEYRYSLTATSSVKSTVSSGAGTGKVKG